MRIIYMQISGEYHVISAVIQTKTTLAVPSFAVQPVNLGWVYFTGHIPQVKVQVTVLSIGN